MYDPAGRRKNANREDGTTWDYNYNSRSEIEGASKKTAAGTTVPGLGFRYSFDGIGNRLNTSVGSDLHLTELSYTPNALNQYSSLTHSGKFWSLVRSDAPVTATATTPAPGSASIAGITQVSNFYGAKVTVPNSSSGKFVKNTFLRNGVAVAGGIDTWTTAATYSPIHDLDGNLTNDGRWLYSWDGESRLISMTPTATAIANGAPNIEVSFAYDYASRRIGKTVVDKRVIPNITRHFSCAYDGWNPVAEWERTGTTLTLKHTHLWGLDLGSSGTAEAGTSANFQQAGGVAGLIASSYHNPSTRDHFIPGYDANGNIIAWTSGTGALVKKIDYDAFGNEVIAENFGDVAKLPAFGFSTKIKDRETGLSYYGYRYYDPVTGRWLSRDPIEEEGGANLYVFLDNNGVDKWDWLGLLKDGDDFDSVKIKKMHIKWAVVFGFKAGDGYGHWWFEIDGSESYGWWPAEGLNLAKTLRGVRGDLNGQTLFSGTPTTDPHHGDPAEENYSAKLNFGGVLGFFANKELEYGSGKGTKCECATCGEVKDCLSDFAKSYSGQWSHPWGNSCHDFLVEALDACCLED